jgi:hypothetical protein
MLNAADNRSHTATKENFHGFDLASCVMILCVIRIDTRFRIQADSEGSFLNGFSRLRTKLAPTSCVGDNFKLDANANSCVGANCSVGTKMAPTGDLKNWPKVQSDLPDKKSKLLKLRLFSVLKQD